MPRTHGTSARHSLDVGESRRVPAAVSGVRNSHACQARVKFRSQRIQQCVSAPLADAACASQQTAEGRAEREEIDQLGGTTIVRFARSIREATTRCSSYAERVEENATGG